MCVCVRVGGREGMKDGGIESTEQSVSRRPSEIEKNGTKG